MLEIDWSYTKACREKNSAPYHGLESMRHTEAWQTENHMTQKYLARSQTEVISSWCEAKRVAQEQERWKATVDALCPSWDWKDQMMMMMMIKSTEIQKILNCALWWFVINSCTMHSANQLQHQLKQYYKLYFPKDIFITYLQYTILQLVIWFSFSPVVTGVSLRVGHQANWPTVSMIYSTWFDHLK